MVSVEDQENKLKVLFIAENEYDGKPESCSEIEVCKLEDVVKPEDVVFSDLTKWDVRKLRKPVLGKTHVLMYHDGMLFNDTAMSLLQDEITEWILGDVCLLTL